MSRTRAKAFKALRPLIDAAQKAGWEVGVSKKCHIQFKAPEGTTDTQGEPVRTIMGPGTPSDWRSYRNMRAQLRRAGLDC